MKAENKVIFEQVKSVLAEARRESEPQKILEMIPYGAFIGATAEIEANSVLYRLEKRPSNIGNPTLPALHGGVIGGFLELCAGIELLYTLDIETVPKVADFSLDFLRPGRYNTTYARCSVLRHGKRLANVSATAWQEDPDKPIATARCHFLIS